MAQIFDGFWLPEDLRSVLITADTEWVVQYRAAGKPDVAHNPQSVGARWPKFTPHQWEYLFDYLADHREPIPPNFVSKLKKAFAVLFQQFQTTNQPFSEEILTIFNAYTGYSREMIRFSMAVYDDTHFEALEKMYQVEFPGTVKTRSISLQELNGPSGWIRFFSQQPDLVQKLFPTNGSRPLSFRFDPPQMVLGYASGNVLGAAFFISLLAQLSALSSPPRPENSPNLAPSVLVKNSRQEPLFVPFLFSSLEKIDPDLVRSIAIMIWDYQDTALQELIISKADVVLAAAADSTIQQIGQVINNCNPTARYHQHGHKISFTTIGKAYLKKEEASPHKLFEDTALLAALDSILWDQNGCLSSRIHFIERCTRNHFTPVEYGRMLTEKLRGLSKKLPRGMIPLSRIHDRFDLFNAQSISSGLEMCSNFEDDFIVVMDDRPWDQRQFKSILNTCMERTIVIRPIESVLDVPKQYLNQIAPHNLQTMYVAISGKEENKWDSEFTQFVEQIGRSGITSIRSVGQSPFPQMAYSWDGFLPQSLSMKFPKGYFTTTEFDQNYTQISKTAKWLEEHLN